MGRGRRGGRIAGVVISSVLILLSLAGPSAAQPGPISLSITRGPVGASVIITGTTLSATTAVSFDGVAAQFTIDSDEQLTATVPRGAATGLVQVDDPDGSVTSTDPFVVQPNIVVILTDDQRWDSLGYMPVVSSELVDHGVTFTKAFVENPLCCPSRASFLTGNDSHTTGVYTNDAPDGGFAAFNDSATLATWLNDAGYDTFLAGKYLNHYWETNGSYVPPGWDGWRAFASTPEYFNYDISLDGTANQSYGASEADYSTDVITGYADTAIRQASPQDPLFLWVAPFAPHGPSTPAPRDVGTLSGLDPWRPPSYNERNVSDKPGYVQATPRLSTDAQAAIDAERQAQLETLGAVDDGVQTILSALRDTGRLSDTMIVFTSDNGFLWGEHRRDGKNVPYDESIRIPLVIRWDRVIGAASTDGHMVQNVDLAPTIVQAAGASASSFDGRTLMPLLTGGTPQWRTNMLIEHVTNEVPSYCADRTPKDILVHYATGEEEYYRLGANADPLEDINRISSTKFAPRISLLRDKLRQMCTPLPPGLPGF